MVVFFEAVERRRLYIRSHVALERNQSQACNGGPLSTSLSPHVLLYPRGMLHAGARVRTFA